MMITVRRALVAAAFALALPAAASAQSTADSADSAGQKKDKPAQGAHGERAGHAMHHTGWKEMDDFHMVMMATWHPAKRSDDLAPIRARAGDMAAAARTWAASTAPAKCAGEKTAADVKAVADDAAALEALVKRSGSDAEVKSALSGLHDRFEAVMHACAGEH